MKYIFIIFAILCSTSLHADYLNDLKRNSRVVIVYGANAPEKEQQMAREIFDILELDKCNDLFDHIITDDYLLRFTNFYIRYNLIVIGNKNSNRLCSINQEIQMSSLPIERTLSPKLNGLYPPNSTALFSARYGYYPKPQDIGFIRRMLNPFLLQAYNLSNGKVHSNPPTTITFLNGTSSKGVLKACDSFLDAQLLEGFIVPRKQLAPKNSRFRLSLANQSFSTPHEINNKFQLTKESGKLEYKGWIQGALVDYSGLKRLCGVNAQQIFHLKLQSNKNSLMTFDEQQNTLMLIKFATPEDSLKGIQGLDKALQLGLNIQQDNSLKIYSCNQGDRGWLLIRKGKFLIIENLNASWKDTFARKVNELFK